MFSAGTLVEMHGLRQAQWLNGHCGIVIAYDESESRYVVQRLNRTALEQKENQTDQERELLNERGESGEDFYRLKPNNLRLSPTSPHRSALLQRGLAKILSARVGKSRSSTDSEESRDNNGELVAVVARGDIVTLRGLRQHACDALEAAGGRLDLATSEVGGGGGDGSASGAASLQALLGIADEDLGLLRRCLVMTSPDDQATLYLLCSDGSFKLTGVKRDGKKKLPPEDSVEVAPKIATVLSLQYVRQSILAKAASLLSPLEDGRESNSTLSAEPNSSRSAVAVSKVAEEIRLPVALVSEALQVALRKAPSPLQQATEASLNRCAASIPPLEHNLAYRILPTLSTQVTPSSSSPLSSALVSESSQDHAKKSFVVSVEAEAYFENRVRSACLSCSAADVLDLVDLSASLFGAEATEGSYFSFAFACATATLLVEQQGGGGGDGDVNEERASPAVSADGFYLPAGYAAELRAKLETDLATDGFVDLRRALHSQCRIDALHDNSSPLYNDGDGNSVTWTRPSSSFFSSALAYLHQSCPSAEGLALSECAVSEDIAEAACVDCLDILSGGTNGSEEAPLSTSGIVDLRRVFPFRLSARNARAERASEQGRAVHASDVFLLLKRRGVLASGSSHSSCVGSPPRGLPSRTFLIAIASAIEQEEAAERKRRGASDHGNQVAAAKEEPMGGGRSCFQDTAENIWKALGAQALECIRNALSLPWPPKPIVVRDGGDKSSSSSSSEDTSLAGEAIFVVGAPLALALLVDVVTAMLEHFRRKTIEHRYQMAVNAAATREKEILGRQQLHKQHHEEEEEEETYTVVGVMGSYNQPRERQDGSAFSLGRPKLTAKEKRRLKKKGSLSTEENRIGRPERAVEGPKEGGKGPGVSIPKAAGSTAAAALCDVPQPSLKAIQQSLSVAILELDFSRDRQTGEAHGGPSDKHGMLVDGLAPTIATASKTVLRKALSGTNDRMLRLLSKICDAGTYDTDGNYDAGAEAAATSTC